MDRGEPWWVERAVEFLARLAPWEHVFEWGGGASTLWLAQRCSELVTVEHEHGWYLALVSQVGLYGLDHVQVRHIRREEGGSDYAAYASAIGDYPDGHFDLVAVDGRNRVECVRNAIPKLRPGGILVLDNSERTEYDGARAAMAGWTYAEFMKGPHGSHPEGWGTTIWWKPGG